MFSKSKEENRRSTYSTSLFCEFCLFVVQHKMRFIQIHLKFMITAKTVFVH